MSLRRGGKSGVAVRFLALLVLIGLTLWVRVPLARAVSDAEQAFLSLYFTDEELRVFSATRSLQSISRIAENVTVVTANDIELMNAHTLADVLESVPGVTMNPAWHFAGNAAAETQGPDLRNVTVLLNGVPLNNLSDNIAGLGTVPVQDIAKVEIIKGPASSVWGSAMGGVINIITKAPGTKLVQGTVSLDYGSESTGDYRAAISGTSGRLGYYLSGTILKTDGLVEGFDVDAGHLGARLNFDFTDRTSASFTLFYDDNDRGDGVEEQYDLSWNISNKHLVSQLAVTSAVGGAGRLDLSLWTTRLDDQYFMHQSSDGTELSHNTFQEHRTGASAKYAVGLSSQSLVFGAEYSAGKIDASTTDEGELEQDQWALFANDTIAMGKLTIIPGLRFDDFSYTDSFWSPSLGLTYLLAKDTLFRATVARGFSNPTRLETSGNSAINKYQANPDLTVEKMWSYQMGFESAMLDFLWLKVSAYQHDVEDAIVMKELAPEPDFLWTSDNGGRQRRRGLDLEFMTKPIHNFTFAASACFLKVRDLETGEDLLDVPEQLYDVSLKYDDQKSFRALLKGRSLRMEEPDYNGADLGGFIVDLNLIKKVFSRSGISIEVFLNGHNLLDENQYFSKNYPNPGRWVEGGLRASF